MFVYTNLQLFIFYFFILYLGYPFALFQRYFLFQKETYLIHLYNVFTGLSIAYFNFGKMSLGRESFLPQGTLWFGRTCSGKMSFLFNLSLFLVPQGCSSFIPCYVSSSSSSS